jgi:peptide/nickel transport system substrate-binding protein
MQRLRAAWLDAPDLAAQQKICQQIQMLAMQEVFYVPTGIYYQPTVYQNTLTGVLKGFPVFYNLHRV